RGAARGLAERIHEEGGAPADFFAQQGDAGAGMIEGFDDDVFELFAQELLDGAFVLFLYLGVIGQKSGGAKAARFGFAAGMKELLHGIGGVGAIAKDLINRSMARAGGGKFFACGLELARSLFVAAAERGKALFSREDLRAGVADALLADLEGALGRFDAFECSGAFGFRAANGGGALRFGGGMPRGCFFCLCVLGLSRADSSAMRAASCRNSS